MWSKTAALQPPLAIALALGAGLNLACYAQIPENAQETTQTPGEEVGRVEDKPSLPRVEPSPSPESPPVPRPVDAPAPAAPCVAGDTAPPRLPGVARLTALQLRRTLAAITTSGEPDVAALDLAPGGRGFRNNALESTLTPSSLGGWISELQRVIKVEKNTQGKLHVAHLSKSPDAACFTAEPRQEACERRVLASFAALAWRRPATDKEVGELHASLTTRMGRVSKLEALTQVMHGVLLSPRFLMRLQPSLMEGDVSRANPWETASYLSYTLTDRPPDDRLAGLAMSGELRKPEIVRAEVARLAALPAAREKFGQMWVEALQLEGLPEMDKPAYSTNGRWRSQIAPALLSSFANTVGDVFAKNLSPASLVRSPELYANAVIRPLLGLPADSATAMVPVRASEPHMFGILTHPAWLAANGKSREPDPIHRGKSITEDFLCDKVPDAPGDIPPVPESSLSQPLRERLAMHLALPACQTCHAKMDSVGFVFESYSATGEIWTAQPGKAAFTNAGSAIIDGERMPLVGPGDLSRALEGSKAFRGCVLSKLRQFYRALPVTHVDACNATAAAARLQGKDDRILAYVHDALGLKLEVTP